MITTQYMEVVSMAAGFAKIIGLKIQRLLIPAIMAFFSSPAVCGFEEFIVQMLTVYQKTGVKYLPQLEFDDPKLQDELFLGRTEDEARTKVMDLLRNQRIREVIVNAKVRSRYRPSDNSNIKFDTALFDTLVNEAKYGYSDRSIAILREDDLAEIERIERELALVNLSAWYGEDSPFEKGRNHFGVFATKSYPQGTILAEYRGAVTRKAEGDYCLEVMCDPAGTLHLNVDAELCGNLGRFFNDSPRCAGSNQDFPWNARLFAMGIKEIKSALGGYEYFLGTYVVADQELNPGEQIFVSYGEHYWKGREKHFGIRPTYLLDLDRKHN